MLVFAQRPDETAGPGAKPGWPGWYRAGSKSDPFGPEYKGGGGGRGPRAATDEQGRPAREYGYGGRGEDAVVPDCAHQVICTNRGYNGQPKIHWQENMGYTYEYPFT